METVSTLVTWGAVTSDWSDWMQYMLGAADRLGATLTHFGIKAEGLGSKSMRSINDYEMIQAKIQEDAVDWLTGYSLPKDFQTAVFDYHVHLSRSRRYVSIAAKERFARDMIENQDTWIAELGKHCQLERGALFTLNSDESPMLFVSGAVSSDDLKSFSLIKEF